MTPVPAVIGFLTPLFLLGCLAVAIPLIVHLLQKQRAPRKEFSTLRFLKLSVEKTARRRRLRDMLLLLFRMAVVALLAIGLSQPLLTGANVLFSSGSTAVAIVLDNSPSMALADGGQVRFERGRDLAMQVLDLLADGDEVGVLLTGGPSKQQEATYERLENVQRLVEEAGVCLSRADIPATLERARALLKSSHAPNKELYLITDLQKSGWPAHVAKPDSEDEDSQSEDEKAQDDVPLVVVDVHKERPINVSLLDVEIRAPVPAVGMPLGITAGLRNGAPEDQKAQVELTIDRQLVRRSEPVRLGAGETRTVDFDYVPRQSGIHEGRLRILGDDASDLDNRLFFVIDTQSALQVALVDHRTGDEPPHRSGSYYLERALRPISDGPYAIEVTTLKPELLGSEPLSPFAAVICVDLKPPGQSALDALHSYVSAGGTLLWVCGPNNDPAAMSDAAQTNSLLPGKFSIPDLTGVAGLHWGFLEESEPVLKPLATPQSLFLSITVDNYLHLDLPPDGSARTLARLDNGDPALVAHQLGQGRVWTLTTGAHALWTTLPLRPIFVPLVNRFILHTAGHASHALKVPPGNQARYCFADEPNPVTVEVTLPGRQEPTRLTSTPSDGDQEFRFPDTYTAGVYRLRMLEARHPKQFAFAVNPDPAEADPETLTAEQLKNRLGPDKPLLLATDEATLADTIRRLRKGTPLMDVFLILVLIGGVLEIFIANRTGSQEPLPKGEVARDPVREAIERARSFHQLEKY